MKKIVMVAAPVHPVPPRKGAAVEWWMYQTCRRLGDIEPHIVSIAADRLGAACATPVCTEGLPAAAQRTLLTQLAQSGAQLRYHGDFDWAGLQIANHVLHLCGAQPWRMGHADYTQAAASAPHTQRDLADSQTSAAWDAALAPAMRQHGLAIAEEAVVASLLIDLYSGGA